MTTQHPTRPTGTRGAPRHHVLLGAYWGPRPEPLDACVDRLLEFLERIRRVSPLTASWSHPTRRATDPPVPIAFEHAKLRALMAASREDSDPEGIGWSFGAWTGEPSGDSVGLIATCGHSSRHLRNAVTLSWYLRRPVAEVVRPSVAQALLDAVVDAWEPDWATWTTHEWRQLQQPRHPPQFAVGWLTYLADERWLAPRPDDDLQRRGPGVVIRAAPGFDEVDERRLLDLAHRTARAGRGEGCGPGTGA